MVGMTSQPYFFGDRARRRALVFLRRSAKTSGSAGAPSRVLALLIALTVGLGAAFVYVPRLAAASAPGGGFADQRALIASVRDAFVGYWNSGGRTSAAPMNRLTDYWLHYHVAKAVIAALLVGVLATLAFELWRMYLRTDLGARARAAIAAAWSLAATLTLCSVALVAANVQGAIAPFSSLISMLPAAKRDGQFASTLDQVKQGLAHYSRTQAQGRTAPALKAMVDDFTLYHAAFVAIATLVALALIGTTVHAWRRFAKAGSHRRARRAFAALALGSTAASLIVITIAAADLTTVAAPAPALLASFQGSW
jgi:hypothetical protein